MHPKYLSITDFTYDLPKDRIAEKPVAQRDCSKLLIWEQGKIIEDIYKNIADHLPEDSLLIFNDTKVIPARIFFQKSTGAVIEIFCLEPYQQDYTSVMSSKKPVRWKCLIGGAGKWKQGNLEKKIFLNQRQIDLSAELIERLSDAYVVELTWNADEFSFAEVMEAAGEMPLPPYIKRKADSEDRERYQTIFAKEKGSVAAPTAALHFTPGILASLTQKNIETDFVTLHVGAGTFKPVKATLLEGHEMHAEWMDLSYKTIEHLKTNNQIIAVGTTSARTLESLYQMGAKLEIDTELSDEKLSVKQWEVYEEPLATFTISKEKALENVLHRMKKNNSERLVTQTQIIITPGYKFRMINSLITNFHQPQSTLLLLIAAAIGDKWKSVYNHALNNNFRFLSYGDGCLLNISQQS
ncbi:S-adenosylmethionine:tRNA ribosyltransferase-isomerase [soil metagenome]